MLFLKDEEIIKKSRQTIVAPKSILPQASHFMDGLWFVATQELLTFAVVCPQKEKKTIHMNPLIGMIKLNMSCTAKSDYLTILSYYHIRSVMNIQDQFLHGLSLYNGSTYKIWEPFLTFIANFTNPHILDELKDTKETPVRHLTMTACKIRKTTEDKQSFWLCLVDTRTIVIIGSVLTIFMHYHCKKRSSRLSFWLAKNSGKAMKAPMYKSVVVYSWERYDITLADVSSTQQHEENSVIPERVKKQQVMKEDARSAIPVWKLATHT